METPEPKAHGAAGVGRPSPTAKGWTRLSNAADAQRFLPDLSDLARRQKSAEKEDGKAKVEGKAQLRDLKRSEEGAVLRAVVDALKREVAALRSCSTPKQRTLQRSPPPVWI